MLKILPLIFIAVVSVFGVCTKEILFEHSNCDGLLTDTLGTNDPGQVYMPNAFSPNGDGLNDVSRPFTQQITSIEFTIYDENENVIFTTSQLGQGWVPVAGPGTSTKYYFRIQATTTANRHIGLCGNVYALTCFPSSFPASIFKFEDQLTPSGFTGVTHENLPNCP